jgi:hypothetical protein
MLAVVISWDLVLVREPALLYNHGVQEEFLHRALHHTLFDRVRSHEPKGREKGLVTNLT